MYELDLYVLSLSVKKDKRPDWMYVTLNVPCQALAYNPPYLRYVVTEQIREQTLCVSQ